MDQPRVARAHVASPKPMASRSDTASRLIKAPPEAVYAAFVTREAVSKWLAPQGATMEVQAFEPRIGGQFRMTLTFAATPGKSAADTDVVVGRFIDLAPPERVVQAFEFDSADPAFAGTMTMSWTLRVAADGTEVSVTARDVPSGISQADHEAGMQSSLANLATFLEGPHR